METAKETAVGGVDKNKRRTLPTSSLEAETGLRLWLPKSDRATSESGSPSGLCVAHGMSEQRRTLKTQLEWQHVLVTRRGSWLRSQIARI